jgi:hypothetical protein
MSASPQPAKETLVVTKAELWELADWERKYADAKKRAAAAEKELAFRRVALAEKVLGVNSADELKVLNPDQVARKFAKRLENGDWRLGSGAPVFKFVKTSEGRYPSWAKLYVEELGESAAKRIKTETPPTYSYAVEVTLPA